MSKGLKKAKAFYTDYLDKHLLKETPSTGHFESFDFWWLTKDVRTIWLSEVFVSPLILFVLQEIH